MPGLSLIDSYVAELSATLPASIVDELADGLTETYAHHLDAGLAPPAAAQAAVAEFGEPQRIAAAFAESSSGRKTARRLLFAGPAVGCCWAIVLITSRAWTWPVPVLARALFGVALITVICLVAAAAFGRHYRHVCRAAAAACAGTALLDALIISTALAEFPAVAWPLAAAVLVSAGRSAFALRNFPRVLRG